MYIMATIPLHRAIMQLGRGLPIWDCTSAMGPVGTLGLVDDTAVLGSNVEDLQTTLTEVRAVLGFLQQRTNESKFKSIMLKVFKGKVVANQPVLTWGGDKITMVHSREYARLLGGNANVAGGACTL